jgi:two-component system NarL family sensor kinase
VFSRDTNGEVSRIVGVAIDLTDLKATQDALAASNQRLRSILASISDCYFTLDRDFIVTDINEAALRWLKLAPQHAVGRSCFDDFPSFPVQRAALTRAALDGRPLHLEVPSSVRPGRWLDYHIYPSPAGYSVFFRDISERMIAVQTLEKTKGLLDSTLNALSAYVVILDEKGTILLVNQAWRQFLNRSGRFIPDDGIGASYKSLSVLPPISRGNMRRFSSGLERVLNGGAADFRCTFEASVGVDQRWYQIHAARFHSNGWSRIVVAHEDVTDVHLAQKALDDLSERLLHLQEEERQRIAIELHDSTCQHLVAIGLNLMNLRRRFPSVGDAEKLLCDIEGSLDEAHKELRVFSYLLHPPYLEKDGLKATLVRFIEGFSRRTGLRSEFTIADAVDELAIILQRSILRVVQEALTNVHRHAEAGQVAVTIAIEDEHVTIKIIDDGKGITQFAEPSGNGNGERTPGLGVPGMRARVRQFGGSLEISGGTTGTTISARIPLAGNSERAIRRKLKGETGRTSLAS